MRPTSDRLTYCKLAIVTMIWGGTFVAGRFLADQLNPLLAASLRFILASLALLLFMVCARIRLTRPNLRQLAQLALLGFFGIFFYNLCFFYGLQYINASRASLIVALNPAVKVLIPTSMAQRCLPAATVFYTVLIPPLCKPLTARLKSRILSRLASTTRPLARSIHIYSKPAAPNTWR